MMSSIILHIPHSSKFIPNYTYFNEELIANEINLLTDHATDKIFYSNKASLLIANFSRIFCDVERFSDDDLEPMSKLGRGFYYSKTDKGEFLRDETTSYKNSVLENYYKPHHNKLNELVSDSIKKFKKSLIIDCHSFCDKPFESDLVKESNRPEICIGTDKFHTSNELLDIVKTHFNNLGYTTKLNNPYSGTMVNTNSYRIDNRVQSIMIEVNRKLYMNGNEVEYEKVQKLNKEFNTLLDTLKSKNF